MNIKTFKNVYCKTCLMCIDSFEGNNYTFFCKAFAHEQKGDDCFKIVHKQGLDYYSRYVFKNSAKGIYDAGEIGIFASIFCTYICKRGYFFCEVKRECYDAFIAQIYKKKSIERYNNMLIPRDHLDDYEQDINYYNMWPKHRNKVVYNSSKQEIKRVPTPTFFSRDGEFNADNNKKQINN